MPFIMNLGCINYKMKPNEASVEWFWLLPDAKVGQSWSSLLDGYEQPGQPSSQTSMECCNVCCWYG